MCSTEHIMVRSRARTQWKKRSMTVGRLAQVTLELAKFFLEHLRRAGFEVQPEHRFRVALADVEPPFPHVDRAPVEVVDLPLLVPVGDLSDLRILVLDLEVDLPAVAIATQRVD